MRYQPTTSPRGLRVAHLIETDGPGGAERVVAQLAATLQREGGTNVVFLPVTGEGWLARELEGSGVTIDNFHLEKPFSPSCSARLADAFRRHRIEVAHSHEFSMAIYGAWAARRAHIPHVVTMHGRLYYRDRFLRRVALRAAMASSGRIVAVSDSLAQTLSGDLWVRRSSIQTVPNGVHYEAPDSVTLRRELGLDVRDLLAVSIGNLYPVKGHRYLVDALALLGDRYPTLHAAIAGRGEEDRSLEELARRHGVSTRLHLLGLRADVPAILAAADLFVLPSLSEALPLALLEAMFAARPIVATDVGEVAGALAGGEAGVLVEPGNPSALAAAIDGLLGDPLRARRLGACAAARAHDEYDVSRMVTRYTDIYRAIVSYGSPGRVPMAAPSHLAQ